MSPTETAALLRQLNAWRRGDEDIPQPDPIAVGKAIDAAVETIESAEEFELLDRLESAEKERDNANAAAVNIALEAERLQCENDALRAAVRHEADCLEACKAEVKALRAKIDAMECMEKQEPSREWWDNLIADISAIDCVYRGDPSYAHDAYWLRERVMQMFEQRRDALPGAKGEEK